jgi:hypothetical protein
LAQLVARFLHTEEVVGSSPASPTMTKMQPREPQAIVLVRVAVVALFCFFLIGGVLCAAIWAIHGADAEVFFPSRRGEDIATASFATVGFFILATGVAFFGIRELRSARRKLQDGPK